MSELDGTELERTANVFDLSFVPDDMTFDEDFRYGLSSHELLRYISNLWLGMRLHLPPKWLLRVTQG